jgi:hypothetical protein
MRAVCIVLFAAVPIQARGTFIAAQREWLSFEGAQECPVTFQTRIPAQADFIDGPDGRRAVRVTVPDIERDEGACAFTLPLPPVGEGFNAARIWLKGSENTKRLEIVFLCPSGTSPAAVRCFGADVPLDPGWQQVVLGPNNTRPYFDTREGTLDLAKATTVRFCFGTWQGHRGGPHEVSIGPVMALQSPLMAPARLAEVVEKPDVPLPPQPFTVELLDLGRGRWHFDEPLGSRLDLDGPVGGYAFAGQAGGEVRLAYLCCDPEFPDDLGHAALKAVPQIGESGEALLFRVEEPHFACGVTARAIGDGAYQCELHDIRLGPPVQGDTYVAAMYLLVGTRACPLWLLPGEAAGGLHLRLLTDRVGNVSVGDEPVKVTLAAFGEGEPQELTVALKAVDYATGEPVWRGNERIACERGRVARHEFSIPLKRFGVFEVSASAGTGTHATVRICRIPRPRGIAPDRSAVGINVFQQQIWWYAYQVPLMAKAGVHWVRPWLAWENTWRMQEPQQGAWDTRALDAALRRMDAHGQRYEDILFGAPDWVTGGGQSGVPPIDKMAEWGAYVERLASQYSGRIAHYEVWNEPDLMWPEETRHGGEHYLAMLKATYRAAKRADPGCTIDGLSHAGYEAWLENVGKLGAKRYLDVVTIHTYAAPHDFATQVQRRRDILRRYGMGDKILWINEFGVPAYDFSPEYSAEYRCSERRQATTLAANYAQALSFDPNMKAFWFCTYDPRDAATQSQWTWDAGIGVLYLGFLPKLSYAALAGVAQQLDGRECLGRANVTSMLHQVSFAGPVALVWHDDPDATSTGPATRVGCAARERIIVKDMFRNRMAEGKAGDIELDLGRGALYIEGSRQMAGVARAEAAIEVRPERVELAGGTGSVSVSAPRGAEVQAQPGASLPITVQASPAPGGTGVRLSLAAREGVERAWGWVRVRVALKRGAFGLIEPAEVARRLFVTWGEPNLIRDGSFVLGDLLEWTPERTSLYAWDPDVGHDAPGSLRLDAPFDRRLVHWNIAPRGGRALRMKLWVKTEKLEGCAASANLALFGPEKWLTTWCLASTREGGEENPGGGRRFEGTGTIPSGDADWTPVEATLPAALVPEETSRAAFYIDVKGGTARIWFDDIDVWQLDGTKP